MSTNLFIIDDDEEILNLLKLALSKASYKIESANNYIEAIEKIDKGYKPDIIILDYYLPEVDGIILAKEFLKRGIKAPVFLFTAADFDNINISGCPENIIDIIRKPFSFEELLQKLDQTERYSKFFSRSKEYEEANFNHRIDLSDEYFTKKIVDIQKFLDKISHKIKNSLQTIANYVELLKKGYIDEEEKEKVFQTILDKVKQIKSELDILKRPAEFYFEEKFSLKSILRTSLSLLKNEIKRKNIYIKTDFQKDLPLHYGRRGLYIEFFKELFRKIVDCSNCSGKINIKLSMENGEFIVDIIQENIMVVCKDLLNFFEVSLKDEKEIKFAKTLLDFKDIGGRIIIETDREGRGIYKVIVSKNDNVSDRD